MKITIIGCGTPTPVPEAFGTAHVVEAAGQRLLFDCGPGTTQKLVKAGILPTSIDHVFFTHHHSDHNAGFPVFLLTRWDQNVPADRALHVYGPKGTRRFANGLIDEKTGPFAADWLARVNHPASQTGYRERGGVLPRKKPLMDIREVGPGDAIEGAGWRVTAAQALHVEPWLESLAYRLDAEGRSVVTTGDTLPCDSVGELCRGADVMLAHVLRPSGSGHSVSSAVEMAKAASVKSIVMVHVDWRLRRPENIAQRDSEAASVGFDGPIIWGEELMEVPLP